MPNPTRGGRRPVGRPPVSDTERAGRYSVSLKPGEAAECLKHGLTVGKGLVALVRRAMTRPSKRPAGPPAP